MSLIVRDAKTAFNYLNGVFCIYKASKTPYRGLIDTLKNYISEDLNRMETRPAKEIVRIVGNVGVDKHFKIQKSLSLADHVLVVGERYTPKNILIDIYNNLGLYVSGVSLVGVGEDGCSQMRKIRKQNLIKEYEITCRLGLATLNFFEKGKMIKESKYKYVTSHKINKLLNSIQAANTRYALKSLGASMHSERAYEILSKGPIRPERKSDPVLYLLKCTEFKEPYFKLRISCVNENYLYFCHLVNQIGLRLKTHACVSTIVCTRLGKFTIDDSICYKEYNAESIINNMTKNYDKVQELLKNVEFNQNIKINNNLNTEQANYRSPLIELD